MQNFIVLGIIPGTHYQTTFTFWLGVAAAFISLLILLHIFGKRHAIRAYFIGRKVARLINHYQILV